MRSSVPVFVIVALASSAAIAAQLQPAARPAQRPATAAPTAPAAGTSPAAAEVEAVGVVRSPTPGRSVAILRSQGRTRVVSVGDTAFGAKLLSVGTTTVTVEIGGRPVELTLTQAPALPRPAPPPAIASEPAGAPAEDPATPAREMDRRQVQTRLADEMTRILADTAVAPVMEDGRVVGVQLTRIAEGSLLTDAGLRSGDVLTRINDQQIDGMATLIGLWPRLQNATELRAVVLRGGQPVSLRVSLR